MANYIGNFVKPSLKIWITKRTIFAHFSIKRESFAVL